MLSISDLGLCRLIGGEVKDRHKMARGHTSSKIRIKSSSSNTAIVRFELGPHTSKVEYADARAVLSLPSFAISSCNSTLCLPILKNQGINDKILTNTKVTLPVLVLKFENQAQQSHDLNGFML